MIKVHRLNGTEFVVNCEHIRFVESTPDTLITLGDGHEKIMVRETLAEIIEATMEYKLQTHIFPKQHL